MYLLGKHTKGVHGHLFHDVIQQFARHAFRMFQVHIFSYVSQESSSLNQKDHVLFEHDHLRTSSA